MFTLEEIVLAMKGKLFHPARVVIQGVSTNTRTIKKNDLFIAIKGEKFDAHHFLGQAVKSGACAVVISDKKFVNKVNVPVILVKDTTQALGYLAGFHRQRFKIPVIAITGSAGKTTTKEMIAAVLSSKFKVLKNYKTENNQFGVPLTLLGLNKSHEVAVIEIGTNRPGDIRWLTEILKPTIAVFTNIGDSHLALLKSKSGVFKEKTDLIRGKRSGGEIIFNQDDEFLKTIKSFRTDDRKVGYSVQAQSNYKGRAIEIVNNLKLRFKINNFSFSLQTSFAHNVYNALAAVACGRALGVSWDDISKRLARFKFESGRQEIKKIKGYWIIDDSYNANPVSFRSALQTLSRLKINGRRIVVCGDMLELGQASVRLHEELGRFVAGCPIQAVFSTGKLAELIAHRSVEGNSKILGFHCDSTELLNKELKAFCRPGDAILIKGSRGMHLEKVLEFLINKL